MCNWELPASRATAIPKFILIDKNGKVVNFNAPSPGDKSVEDLIQTEIAKTSNQ